MDGVLERVDRVIEDDLWLRRRDLATRLIVEEEIPRR